MITIQKLSFILQYNKFFLSVYFQQFNFIISGMIDRFEYHRYNEKIEIQYIIYQYLQKNY